MFRHSLSDKNATKFDPMAKLPSTFSLLAFETAARWLSFAQAALELNVTPSAVSRQIATLERQLGVALFQRQHRKVALSPAGRDYLAGVRPVLADLAAVTARASRAGAARTVSLLVYPTFAQRWLIPRLGRFYDAHPGIDLRLTTSLDPVDFTRDGYDLAIRAAAGRLEPGLRAAAVMEVVTFPVCAPALARRLKKPADLAGQTLIVGKPRPDDWRHWLRQQGLNDLRSIRWLEFQSLNLAFQAAIEGLGLVMAIEALVGEDLRARRLERPFGALARTGQPMELVYPAAKERMPELVALRDWLLAEAQLPNTPPSARARNAKSGIVATGARR